MSKLNLTSTDIEQAAKKLVKKLKRYGFKKSSKKTLKKTLVIGVGRGGLIAAQYVAYGLGIRHVDTIQSELYDGETKDEKKMKVTGVLTLNYDDYDHFILVDDLIDSGLTLSILTELIENTADEFDEDIIIVPAVLYSQQPDTEVEVIVGELLPKTKKGKNRWVNFPWDTFMEDK